MFLSRCWRAENKSALKGKMSSGASKANTEGCEPSPACFPSSFICHPDVLTYLHVLREGWKWWETWKVIVWAFKITLKGCLYLYASYLSQTIAWCPLHGKYSMANTVSQNSFNQSPVWIFTPGQLERTTQKWGKCDHSRNKLYRQRGCLRAQLGKPGREQQVEQEWPRPSIRKGCC